MRTSFLAVLLAAPLAAQGEEAFVRAILRVRAAMDRGQFQRADKLMRTALRNHESQPYVHLRRPQIEEFVRQCEFGASYVPAAPAELVSGNLIRFQQQGGRIEIEYGKDGLGDFRNPAKEAAEREKKRKKARKKRGRFVIEIKSPDPREDWPKPLFHPAVFYADYEVVCEGGKYPHRESKMGPKLKEHAYPGVVLLVGVSESGSYAVEFGYLPANRFPLTVDARIVHYPAAGQPVVLAKAPSQSRPGLSFRCKVKVTRTSIQAFAVSQGPFEKKPFMKATIPRGNAYGTCGVQAEGFDRIHLAGKAHASWVEGRQDAARRKQWVAFQRDFDPKKRLPQWLLEDPKPLPRPDPRAHAWPDELEQAQEREASRVLRLIRSSPKIAMEELGNGLEVELPETTRLFLDARIRWVLGDHESALAACDRLIELAPTFAPGAGLRGSILRSRGRADDAIAQYLRMAEQLPHAAYAYFDALLLLVSTGQRDRAREVMRQCVARHGAARELVDLQRVLWMLEAGPSWPRAYEYESRNYIVRSDIDRKTCVDASKILERAYAAFQSQYGRIPRDRKERLRVYLFRGESGYQAYTSKILGAPKPHTAGLFSPALQQLLIWNLPDRDAMLRTVRHEGLHQYLDSLIGRDVPIWLNEGLAEYNETAELTSSALVRGGQARNDYVETLRKRSKNLTPWRRFLTLPPGLFYARSREHYPQAWLLVHFLHHGESKYRAVLKQLIDGLRAGQSSRAVQREVFADVDWKALEADLREYLRAM